MSKKDDYKYWEEQINCAKKKREDWAREFEVDKGWDYYKGKVNPGFPAEEWVNVNKIYSHLQAQLPTLYSMDPYFYVKLKKSYQIDPNAIMEYDRKAKGRQGMLNYLKAELKLKEKARMGILDAHFEYGVLKVRRAADSQKHPQAGNPILSDSGQPLKDETGKEMVYPDKLPVNERYEILWVKAEDFLLDEDAGPLEDSWSWCGHHFQLSKANALEDDRFKASAIKSAQPKTKEGSKAKRTGITSWFSSDADEDDEVLDFWEIYDLKKREWLIFVEDGSELPMVPRGTPEGITKHPFSVLMFSPLKDTAYPIPPVFNALDPQKEYSLSRSRLLTHRKRFNRKYQVNVNMLTDEDDLSKLESGEDGTFIRVQAMGAVEPIKDAPLDQQNLQELMLLNTDMVEIFGTPDSARAVASADSATEASILDKRLEIREGDRTGSVKDWIITAMTKLDKLVQCHIDRDEAVKVLGPEGEFWQTIHENDYDKIDGEYEYSVNLGASQPRIPQLERAQWIAFLTQVIVPMPAILTAPQTMKRMAEMFGIEDEAAIEELRQLGLKMMSGQIPMPGQQGGGPSNNPIAAILGAAQGAQGGTANGGGSPMVRQ